MNPYAPHLARTPELTNIYMTSGLDVPLESRDWGWLASEQDVAHLGGAPPDAAADAARVARLPVAPSLRALPLRASPARRPGQRAQERRRRLLPGGLQAPLCRLLQP